MFTVLAETKINHYENLFVQVCSSLTAQLQKVVSVIVEVVMIRLLCVHFQTLHNYIKQNTQSFEMKNTLQLTKQGSVPNYNLSVF